MNTQQAANPYAAPGVEVADVHPGQAEVQHVRFWSYKGRIGRLRYLSYNVLGYLLISIVVGVVFAAAASIFRSREVMVMLPMLLIISYSGFFILLSIRRSHDMGWTGWSALLCLIPFVSLIWVFYPGTKGMNRFGAPPQPNGTGVVIGALLVPIIAVVGILAAIALPAYHDYAARAKAAQAAKP